MFQSEALQEKWAPVLDYDGLDKIEDSHKRAVTAVLLENQEKFLREQSAFENGSSMLTEQPTHNAGSTTGGVDGYFSTRVVITYDSSSVSESFTAPYAELRDTIVVGAIRGASDTGSLYFQQVQVSGDA